MVISIVPKLLVYPTLFYGVALEYAGLRKWYTRFDDHCILGAMPMRRNYKEIVAKENVKAVLTLNQDHELLYSLPKAEWTKMNIDYKQIGINDYVGLPSLEQIAEGVEFISKHTSCNNTVYVHCKAGRYRSALFVACYLMHSRNMKPEEAVEYIRNLRPNVILHRVKQTVIMKTYYDGLIKTKEKLVK
jgi:atypical dual specificity phosphatase